ncbi:MAG TPA: hypothetical protein PK867_21405, partial [Pirellulales bacterium]|nr:hypothetical protein [Pirellulales bacterium]
TMTYDDLVNNSLTMEQDTARLVVLASGLRHATPRRADRAGRAVAVAQEKHFRPVGPLAKK